MKVGSTEGSARDRSDPVPPWATGPELSSVSLTTDPYATGSEGFFPRPPQTLCSLGVASSSHSGGLLPSFLLGRPESPNLPSSGALGRTARQRGAPPAQCRGDRPPVEPPVGPGCVVPSPQTDQTPRLPAPSLSGCSCTWSLFPPALGALPLQRPAGLSQLISIPGPSAGPRLLPLPQPGWSRGGKGRAGGASSELGRSPPRGPWGPQPDGERRQHPGSGHTACPPPLEYQQRPRHRDALKTASTVPARPTEARRTAETRRNQERTGPAGPQHLDRLSVPDLVLQTSGSSVSRQCPGA